MNIKGRRHFLLGLLTVVFLLGILPPVQAASAPISTFKSTYTFTTIDVPDAVDTVAEGINDHGQIVGAYTDDDFGPFQGFLYDDGEFTTIHVPDGFYTVAFGINNHGKIVGSYVNNEQHGFLYRSKKNKDKKAPFTAIDVPFPTGVFLTRATDINNHGQIVGEYLDNPTSNEQHGFLYKEGLFTSIDVPGALITSAFGINDHGQIAGFYEDSHGQHGFVRDGDVFTTIDVPFAGGLNTVAMGINNHGQIVGTYIDGQGVHGYVYDDGVFNSIDVPGALDTIAIGINKHGQIVGFYNDGVGTHGFVATPKKKIAKVASISQGTLDQPRRWGK